MVSAAVMDRITKITIIHHPAVTIKAFRKSENTTSLNQSNENHDDRNDQQDVNEATHRRAGDNSQ